MSLKPAPEFDGRTILALRALRDREIHAPALDHARRGLIARGKLLGLAVGFMACAGLILLAVYVLGWN